MNRKNKRDMRIKTFMLFAITLLIWALLFVVKLHFWGADGESIIDDIVSNMIGIIPPLLIFDFGLEYLTRDNIANDISEKITQTLLGESEAIGAFKDDDSSLESATHNIDSFEFNIQDKWIYPMSGVVFAINTEGEGHKS